MLVWVGFCARNTGWVCEKESRRGFTNFDNAISGTVKPTIHIILLCEKEGMTDTKREKKETEP